MLLTKQPAVCAQGKQKPLEGHMGARSIKVTLGWLDSRSRSVTNGLCDLGRRQSH